MFDGVSVSVGVSVVTNTPKRRGIVAVRVSVSAVNVALTLRTPAVCVFFATAVCVFAMGVLLGLGVLVEVRVRVFVCVFVGDIVRLAATILRNVGVSPLRNRVEIGTIRAGVCATLAVADRVRVMVNDAVSVKVAVVVLVTVALAIAVGVTVGVRDTGGATLVVVAGATNAVPLLHGVGVTVADALSVTVMSITPGIVSVGVPIAGQGSIVTTVAVGIFFGAANRGTRISRNGPWVGLLNEIPRATAASTVPSANARFGTMVILATMSMWKTTRNKRCICTPIQLDNSKISRFQYLTNLFTIVLRLSEIEAGKSNHLNS